MSIARWPGALALALSLGACGAIDTATRNLPLPATTLSPAASAAPAPSRADWTVQDIRVTVPRTLRVSERGGYYPFADIVWRGDPAGDRHAQVAALFDAAAARAMPALDGGRPVMAEVTVSRFHGVTERTRYSIGGTYHVVFTLTVRDAATGAVLEGPREVDTSLAAPGGDAALALERAGQTERVRVTNFLDYTLRRELGQDPGRPLGSGQAV